MKRRVFLSTTGTVGLAGAASGASVVSSVYSSISTNVSLAEFSSNTKAVLDHFIAELKQNIQELGLNEDHSALVAMPVRIVKKEVNTGDNRIIYKNKAGNYVTLQVQNGVKTIRVTNSI